MSQSSYVWAVFNFPGTTDEDLPLVAGERIEVISRDDEFGDGWWEGINASGQQGLFPKIYTSERAPTGEPLNGSAEPLDDIREERSDTSTIYKSSNGHATQAPNVNPVPQWTPEDVAAHFEKLGLDDAAPKFIEHKVNGRILLNMAHTDLREIDIITFATRYEIMREIETLRNATSYDSETPRAVSQADSGTSTPPLRIEQKTRSVVMPQESATGAILQTESYSLSTDNSIDHITNNAQADLAPAILPGSPLYKPLEASLDQANFSSPRELPTLVVNPNGVHKKSMSISSLSYTAVDPESNQGRRSPEKGHTRAWSQDTLKRNSLNRRISGTLEPVDEQAPSMSTDSTPPTPSSTIGSPRSSVPNGFPPSSPSTSTRQASLIAKKSILSRRPKWRPNAVSENLEQISAPESAKDADFCGWLRKRGERSYNWKLRYFVLKGTRLAYYQSDRDTSEKGLIDINSHRVVPVDDMLFYGPSKHIFKLLPPAPGASRALNFTPPKTHFFCADTKEQMRQWITAFTKATIGRDWSTPVISSCTTKTISLNAARQLRNTGQSIDSATADSEPLPSPILLTPEEIVAQQQASKQQKRISGHIARNLSISSDSSLRRAVLSAARED